MVHIKTVNKTVLLTILIISMPNITFSQSTKDIFSRTGEKIVWLGNDFTQVRLIGPLGTVGEEELIPLFHDINQLIISERSKYNFAAALRKDEVPYDIMIATKLNSSIDPGTVIVYASTDEEGKLNEETISVLVKQYKVENTSGIGLVFFIESFDKVKERGTMWVTFFSLADHNVLFTERMAGTAGGISFRNHWARPVYEVIQQIRNTKFAEWRFRYVR